MVGTVRLGPARAVLAGPAEAWAMCGAEEVDASNSWLLAPGLSVERY